VLVADAAQFGHALGRPAPAARPVHRGGRRGLRPCPAPR
jgi:hypothetical protein